MNVAQQGLTQAGLWQLTLARKFREALQKYITEQAVQLSLDLAFACADLMTDGIGDFAAKAGEAARETGKEISFFKKKSTYYLMKFFTQARGAVTDFGETCYSIDKLREKMPPGIRDLSGTIADDIAKMGLPPGPDMPGDPLQALMKSASSLNERLLYLGQGAWQEYVAQGKAQYNNFLYGYSGGVAGAAQSFMDGLEVQASYGNQFFTYGSRYVASVQQYLINQAQLEAYNQTQNGINDVYKVLDQQNEYNMFQEGILAIQINTLALQMHQTIQQLCQSFEYQTTRLYKNCVGPGLSNKLNDVCGDFAHGEPGFKPFLYEEPCESGVDLATAASNYLKQWEAAYASAMTVIDYVTNAVWGTDASADDKPFVYVPMDVWDQPPCTGKFGYWETRVTVCNSSVPAGVNVTYLPTSNPGACLKPGANLDAPWVCCKITRFNPNCTDMDPPDKPYISRKQFIAFTNNSDESWGKLSFSLEPRHLPQLNKYDATFVRGISVYLEGAEIMSSFTNLFLRLTPVGAMTTRVMNHSWNENVACAEEFQRNPNTMCMFDNYTFNGAPSGGQATVAYTSYYHNTPELATDDQCPSSLNGQPVFENRYERKVLCNGKPCFYYCTNLDFSSFDSGDAKSMFAPTDPYNFASIFTEYNLQVYNRFQSTKPVRDRSAGIDLSAVKRLHVGFWLKTNGINNQKMDTCSDIGRDV